MYIRNTWRSCKTWSFEVTPQWAGTFVLDFLARPCFLASFPHALSHSEEDRRTDNHVKCVWFYQSATFLGGDHILWWNRFIITWVFNTDNLHHIIRPAARAPEWKTPQPTWPENLDTSWRKTTMSFMEDSFLVFAAVFQSIINVTQTLGVQASKESAWRARTTDVSLRNHLSVCIAR